MSLVLHCCVGTSQDSLPFLPLHRLQTNPECPQALCPFHHIHHQHLHTHFHHRVNLTCLLKSPIQPHPLILFHLPCMTILPPRMPNYTPLREPLNCSCPHWPWAAGERSPSPAHVSQQTASGCLKSAFSFFKSACFKINYCYSYLPCWGVTLDHGNSCLCS